MGIGRHQWLLLQHARVQRPREQHGEGFGSWSGKRTYSTLQHKFHNVYCDNFFTSVQLFKDLEEVGLYACGTARSDRSGFPPSLKKVKLDNR